MLHAASVAGKNGFSLISDEKFRELYLALLQCSLLDERLRTQACYEPWTGHLAGAAGVSACLRAHDTVAPTPRGVIARYLHQGLFDFGMCKSAPTSASHLAMAKGEALRHKLENLGHIVVVYAATGEPDAMRAVFHAAERQTLPVLYVLESSTALEKICGNVPVIRVDATDTVAVYRVAHESVSRARDGGGPTIIECVMWPGEGGDEDPLVKLENYLAAKKLFRRDWKQRLVEKYSRAVTEAVGTIRPVVI